MKKDLYSSKHHAVLLIVFFKICFIFLCFGATAQTAVIRGKVTDAQTSKPLAGVSVSVKGKTTGASTDSSGNFSLAAESKSSLIFSYVGYQAMEISAAGKTFIDVALQPSSGLLSNVVVTALGITRDKRALGYSVSEIKGATL